MKDYMLPQLRNTPNNFIFHAGTNKISSGHQVESIVNTIIDLANIPKNYQISNIILKMDNAKLNQKEGLVNNKYVIRNV